MPTPTLHNHEHTHLYVDTDDTLIIYRRGGTNPYGFLEEIEWELNTALVDAIQAWADTNNAIIRLWSGGGAKYARHVYQQVKARISFPVESFETKFTLASHDSSCSEQNVSAFIDDDVPWINGGLRNFRLATGLENHVRVFEPQQFIDSVHIGDYRI